MLETKEQGGRKIALLEEVSKLYDFMYKKLEYINWRRHMEKIYDAVLAPNPAISKAMAISQRKRSLA